MFQSLYFSTDGRLVTSTRTGNLALAVAGQPHRLPGLRGDLVQSRSCCAGVRLTMSRRRFSVNGDVTPVTSSVTPVFFVGFVLTAKVVTITCHASGSMSWSA